MDEVVGATFDYEGSELIHLSVLEVWANGYAPIHTEGYPQRHRGVFVGHVWEQQPLGWVACPRRTQADETDQGADTWSAMVDRSTRHFRDKREASVFLWGYNQGTRRLQQKLMTIVETPKAREASNEFWRKVSANPDARKLLPPNLDLDKEGWD